MSLMPAFFGARGVWSAYSHACWVAPPAIHETPRIPASCFAIIICRRCDSGGPCTARPAAARCYLPRALRTSILLGLPARLYTRATAIVSPVLFALYANRFPHPISSPLLLWALLPYRNVRLTRRYVSMQARGKRQWQTELSRSVLSGSCTWAASCQKFSSVPLIRRLDD
jgi:hypothetical protein